MDNKIHYFWQYLVSEVNHVKRLSASCLRWRGSTTTSKLMVWIVIARGIKHVIVVHDCILRSGAHVLKDYRARWIVVLAGSCNIRCCLEAGLKLMLSYTIHVDVEVGPTSLRLLLLLLSCSMIAAILLVGVVSSTNALRHWYLAKPIITWSIRRPAFHVLEV